MLQIRILVVLHSSAPHRLGEGARYYIGHLPRVPCLDMKRNRPLSAPSIFDSPPFLVSFPSLPFPSPIPMIPILILIISHHLITSPFLSPFAHPFPTHMHILVVIRTLLASERYSLPLHTSSVTPSTSWCQQYLTRDESASTGSWHLLACKHRQSCEIRAPITNSSTIRPQACATSACDPNVWSFIVSFLTATSIQFYQSGDDVSWLKSISQ